MSATTVQGETAATQRRRAVVASTIGTTIEWYDFFLYGTAAALVFPHAVLPGQSLAGTLLSFGTSSSASPPGRSARRSSATSATGSAARPPWSPPCC